MFKSIQSESMIKKTHHFKSFKVNVSLPTKPTGPRKKTKHRELRLGPDSESSKRMYDVYYLFYASRSANVSFQPSFQPSIF